MERLDKFPMFMGISLDKALWLNFNSSNSFKYEIEEGMPFENLLNRSDSCCNFVRFPISWGSTPLRKLEVKFNILKFWREPTLGLRLPWSELWLKSRYRRCLSWKSWGGMDPLNLFWLMSRWTKLLRLPNPRAGIWPYMELSEMSSTIKLLIKKSGANKIEGMRSENSGYSCAKRLERWRAITTLEVEVEVEFEGEVHVTLSHWQQLELEFHESKVCNEELMARMEDLNWRRACFWYSGQDRHGSKKKRMKMDSSSRLGLAIVGFVASMGVNGWTYKEIATVRYHKIHNIETIFQDGKSHWVGMFCERFDRVKAAETIFIAFKLLLLYTKSSFLRLGQEGFYCKCYGTATPIYLFQSFINGKPMPQLLLFAIDFLVLRFHRKVLIFLLQHTSSVWNTELCYSTLFHEGDRLP